jgi:hypothetical protein
MGFDSTAHSSAEQGRDDRNACEIKEERNGMNSDSRSRGLFSEHVEWRSRLLVVVLMAILLLGTVANLVPVSFGHLAGKTLQGWAPTPPAIDGDIGTSEWQTAGSSSFSLTIGGNPYAGTLYAMNDATNLYIGIVIADDDFNTGAPVDAVALYFDNGNDGTFGPGDDSLVLYAGAGGFVDRFLQAIPTAQKDIDFGGTTDGSGACAAHGGNNHFELSHPLNSADDAHDFSLSAGSTVGFHLEYWEEASGYWGDWPSLNAKNWARITIASVPVPTPDFSIACAPASVSVAQGSSITSTCTVTSLNAFSAAVDLSGSWVGVAPGDVGAVLPTPITPLSGGVATSTLTISAGPGASIGPFTYRVTATSGALIHTADVSVDITAGAADFTISASPSSLSLGPSTSGTSTIAVQSTGIFSSPVSLTSSGAPAGLNVVFGTNPVTPLPGGFATSVVTVSVAGAAAGSYPVTITGTSGALIHSSTLTVQVTTAGGGCLIATATYGSELSPEVQFLRNFRDRSILKTNTGSNFMIAFNAWYYSFSPTVAQFIREHVTVGTAVKVMLYPLIGTLRIGAEAFHMFPTNPEVSAVVSGFLVSSLIGITYATPPTAAVLAYSSRARRVAKRLQMPVLVVLLGALAAVAFVTEVGAPAILMMISTVAIVLASLTVTTLFASRAILRLAKRV